MKLYLLIPLFFLLLFPNIAFAYLDPGAGSMLLQVLLGGIAGLFVVIKLYWRRALSFFKKKETKEDKDR